MPIKQKKEIDEKIRIILKCLKGEISLNKGAREAGISVESLRSWIKIYKNEGIDGFVWKGNRQYNATE